MEPTAATYDKEVLIVDWPSFMTTATNSDAGENIFEKWIGEIARRWGRKYPELYTMSKSAGIAVDTLISSHDAKFIRRDKSGNLHVYSNSRRNQFSADVMKHLSRACSENPLTPETPVYWYDSLDGTPVAATAREVVYGKAGGKAGATTTSPGDDVKFSSLTDPAYLDELSTKFERKFGEQGFANHVNQWHKYTADQLADYYTEKARIPCDAEQIAALAKRFEVTIKPA
jgi:hypothetical protein